jgi:uncharacterized membrane protein (UPF0127 family)
MHEVSVVATELARSIKRLADNWQVRVAFAVFGFLLIMTLIVHRFSPKPTELNCAFRIAESAPETKGDTFKVDNCVVLEEASTNSEQTLGLSGRSSMPRNRGMLFDFHESDEYCMWMKDMHFALDIIWLNQQKEIVYVVENVTPDTYPKSFCGPGEARYVVEVNTGVVKAANLQVGQRLRF